MVKKMANEIKIVDGYMEKDGSYTELARHIFGLCNNHSGYHLQNEFFARWYIKAFPEKVLAYNQDKWFDDRYCIEWIERFLKGTPTIYMDAERMKAYFEVAISWNNSKLRVSEDKTPVLLEWTGSEFKRIILNPALIQDDDEEVHYIVGQYDGIWHNKKNKEVEQ